MSYDICITRAPSPEYEELEGLLDVTALISAFNQFPTFAAAGVTWANEGWFNLPGWSGMTIELEDHAPSEDRDGNYDYTTGEAAACWMHMSFADDSAMLAFCELALNLARATGAHAWDVQTDQDLADRV